MNDEQRVRTMAGWVGVEISKSRARRADNPEFGLYRVRGSKVRASFDPTGGTSNEVRQQAWTAYAYALTEIESEIEAAVAGGRPAKPQDLCLRSAHDASLTMVDTRWMANYRGRRDLGLVAVGAAECGCPRRGDGTEPVLHRCSRCGFEGGYESVHRECAGCPETARQRQRAANAEFQREHLERRAYGLRARYAAKEQRNGSQPAAQEGPNG